MLPSLPPPSPRRDRRIAALQHGAFERARRQPADGYALARSGAYLQKVRETGDAAFYARAAGAPSRRRSSAIRATRRRSPARGARRSRGTTSRRPARRRSGAPASAPEVVRPYGVIVDALVELGRYGAGRARAAADGRPQARTSPPTRASPTSASCTATSTARATRMRAAVAAAATRPRTSPTCRRCSATSSSCAGAWACAARVSREALARFPGYVAAEAGARARGGRARRPARRDPPLARVSSRGCRCPST